jgi:hypothetical protein
MTIEKIVSGQLNEGGTLCFENRRGGKNIHRAGIYTLFKQIASQRGSKPLILFADRIASFNILK